MYPNFWEKIAFPKETMCRVGWLSIVPSLEWQQIKKYGRTLQSDGKNLQSKHRHCKKKTTSGGKLAFHPNMVGTKDNEARVCSAQLIDV